MKEYPAAVIDESDSNVTYRELPDDLIMGGIFEPQNLPSVLPPSEVVPSLIIT